MTDLPRRIFEANELQQAIAFAVAGGQALHLHTICGRRAPKCFRAAIARGEQIAHLFDSDEARLTRTARTLGVQVVVIDKAGTYRSHVDLCAGPLRNALRVFSLSQKSLFPELERTHA